MAFAKVQSTSQRVISGANAKAFASNNTAGNLLIYAFWIENDTATITSLVDTLNSPVAIGSINNGHGFGFGCQLYYVANCAGGANTVTATPSAGASTILILEYSGADVSSPLDTFLSAFAAGSSPPNSGNISTATASELLIGFIVSNIAETAGSGYTIEESNIFNDFSYVEDKTSGAPGTYAADMVNNTNTWLAWIVAFKAPGTGGGSRNLTLLGVG